MPNHWLALPVGNEGINLYIGILGMKRPSFPTKGQLDQNYSISNGEEFEYSIFFFFVRWSSEKI